MASPVPRQLAAADGTGRKIDPRRATVHMATRCFPLESRRRPLTVPTGKMCANLEANGDDDMVECTSCD